MNAAAELAEARFATHSREELLVAAAQASRLLLESSDVMSRMPEVLQLFGEAAGVDRTTLALADVGFDGERWLEIKSQWNAPGVPAIEGCNAGSAWNARRTDCFCNELAAGRSVFLCGSEGQRSDSSIASREAKSSIIVPFLVEGEYAGAVSFDTLRMERRFEAAVVAALEIAASVVGAALQRERLVETMRRERETAAELRVAELARANAALRANLERLAMHPTEFFDHALLETCRHSGANSATAVIASYDSDGWTVGSHACDGSIGTPPFAAHVPAADSPFMQTIAALRDPLHVELRDGERLTAAWPELLAFHRDQGHRSLYLLPLVFGERTIGVVGLGFSKHEPLRSEVAELLIALGQQVTLALAMKRLFSSAKQAAVLAERNRIGREIHDGLAQAFTGILMQLGAAEELAEGSPIVTVMTRIRDIAKEGLTEARRSVLALRPDEPRAGGLELALRQLAERSIVNGRTATRFSGGGATGLPPEHEHALLRIAQEAVINAVRHAQPRNIEIVLDQDGEELRLTIRDDGSGLWQLPEISAQQGFGLTNMRERAEDMGGRLTIESQPGAGTTVTVRVPRGERPRR
jgi:signal transduction histidine kinase